MFTQTNPMYNAVPATAPGIEGLRYMIGDTVAALTGNAAGAYVPPNMSVADATMAKHVNGQLYRSMMANTYRQMGYQIGNTAGATSLAGYFGSMAGLSPEETQRMLSGGGASLAGSFAGQMVMPLLDQGMASIGLTGGSMVAVANAAFSQRMNLMSPGTMLNPLNAGQQHQAMGAASAMSSMLNGLMSQTTKDGSLSLLPNLAVTKGFDRQRIAQLAMRAAGAGAFTSYESGLGAGFAERLSEAAGGVDLASLDYTQGDFTGGKNGMLGKDKAEKVKRLTREFAHRMQGITEAMAAMRDLTHEVDGLEEKLDSLTNGNWLRSGTGGFAAGNAVRTLHAVTMMHNLDPNAAIEQIVSNRGVLQNAAGFTPAMQAMGFNGGGMFGLSAQTELLSNIEDMITARGLRGDPIAANRLRMQGVQAMARNMNTLAGRGSQVLAYARQTGTISEEEALRFQKAMTSGDRGILNDALNQLLVTQFGSREAGYRFMNDQMQMNAMRQSMDDNAGVFAMQTAIHGANAEFAQRELNSAADRRLDFTKRLMTSAGMRSWQSDEDVTRLTESAANSIMNATKDPETGKASADGITHANAFRAQVKKRIAEGMSPRAAIMAVKNAFAQNPATASYSEVIDRALTRQSAANNEYELSRVGRESFQANETMRQLQNAGLIKSADSIEISTMLREGRGKEALARVNSIIGGLDADNRSLFGSTLKGAGERYDAAKRTMEDNKAAEQIIAKAHSGNFSAKDAADAYAAVAAAAKRYIPNKDGAEAWDDFWERYSQSKYTAIFSKEDQQAVLDAVARGDMGFFEKMGRHANAVRRANVGALEKAGYGHAMDGFWGGGEFSGNSPKALEARNRMIDKLSDTWRNSSDMEEDARKTLAQDVAEFFLENKGWKGLLKQYDPSGKLLGKMRPFAKAFRDYETAKSEAAGLYRDYNKAIGSITEKDHAAADLIQEQLKLLPNHGDMDLFAIEALGHNGISLDSKEGKAIMAYAKAKLSESKAHTATQTALTKDLKDVDVSELRQVSERYNAAKRASEKRVKGVEAWLGDLDLDPDGLEMASGSTKYALGKLKRTVSDADVAKKLGVKSLAGKTEEEITRERFRILTERVAKPGDKDATDTLRALKVASNDGVMRVRGKLTLESGNDQQDAEINGNVNVGGLS